jgi:hypothetical protein
LLLVGDEDSSWRLGMSEWCLGVLGGMGAGLFDLRSREGEFGFWRSGATFRRASWMQLCVAVGQGKVRVLSVIDQYYPLSY